MLQQPWSGDIAILGNMANHHHCDVGSLGELQKLGGALPHLAHAACRCGQLRIIHGLNTVDNQELGLDSVSLRQNSIQIRSRHNQQVFVGAGSTKPHGPHRRLLLALLTAHIKHLYPPLAEA